MYASCEEARGKKVRKIQSQAEECNAGQEESASEENHQEEVVPFNRAARR